MKSLKLYILILIATNLNLFAVGPCEPSTLFSLYTNIGLQYNPKNSIDHNWQIGHLNDSQNKYSFDLIFGIGAFDTKYSDDFNLGLDLNIAHKTIVIQSADLSNVLAKNQFGDTLRLNCNANSKLNMSSLILSPFFDLYILKKSNISFSIQPQFKYNLSADIYNTYSWKDSNYNLNLANQEISNTLNGKSVFYKALKNYPKYELNCRLSLGQRLYFYEETTDCQPLSKIITYKINLLIWQSPFSNQIFFSPSITFEMSLGNIKTRK